MLGGHGGGRSGSAGLLGGNARQLCQRCQPAANPLSGQRCPGRGQGTPAEPGGLGGQLCAPFPGLPLCTGRILAGPARGRWEEREAMAVIPPSPVSVQGGRGDGRGAGCRYPVLVGLRWVLGAHEGRRADSGRPTGAGGHRLGWGCPALLALSRVN